MCPVRRLHHRFIKWFNFCFTDTPSPVKICAMFYCACSSDRDLKASSVSEVIRGSGWRASLSNGKQVLQALLIAFCRVRVSLVCRVCDRTLPWVETLQDPGNLPECCVSFTSYLPSINQKTQNRTEPTTADCRTLGGSRQAEQLSSALS